MVVRAAEALKAEVQRLIDDNNAGNITASDVRNVFTDIVDSYVDLVANADTDTGSGVSPYSFYAGPVLTPPTEIGPSDAAVPISDTGTGAQFTLLDSETFQGDLTEADFITEWEGTVYGRVNQGGTLVVNLVTEHVFNGKTLVHRRTRTQDVAADTSFRISMNDFNSRSRVTPGNTYQGMVVTGNDLSSRVAITYKLEFLLFNRRDLTSRRTGAITELHSENVETVSYQLRQARQVVIDQRGGLDISEVDERINVLRPAGRQLPAPTGESGDAVRGVILDGDGGEWILSVGQMITRGDFDATLAALGVARIPAGVPDGAAGQNKAWATNDAGATGWRGFATDVELLGVSVDVAAAHTLAEQNKAKIEALGVTTSSGWGGFEDADVSAGYAYVLDGADISDGDFVNPDPLTWGGQGGNINVRFRMPRGADPTHVRFRLERGGQTIATHPAAGEEWAPVTNVSGARDSLRYYLLSSTLSGAVIGLTVRTNDRLVFEIASLSHEVQIRLNELLQGNAASGDVPSWSNADEEWQPSPRLSDAEDGIASVRALAEQNKRKLDGVGTRTQDDWDTLSDLDIAAGFAYHIGNTTPPG